MIFLSFGAGVQSSVMLMLAIHNEIERPDHVLWADTGFEPRAVYAHVDWAERQCKKARLPFHRVKANRNLRESFETSSRGSRPAGVCIRRCMSRRRSSGMRRSRES